MSKKELGILEQGELEQREAVARKYGQSGRAAFNFIEGVYLKMMGEEEEE